MIKKILLLSFFIVVISFSASAQATTKKPLEPQTVPPPGNINLIDGYTHIKRRGIDTIVGEISKPDGMKIRYDIGALGGLRECVGECVWRKKQMLGEREMWLSMQADGRIIATFPKEYANFYAQTKSPEDIADFLIMIVTYQGSGKPPVPTKAELRTRKQQ